MKTLTETDLKQMITSADATVDALIMRTLAAKAKGNEELVRAWALCGLDAVLLAQMALELVAERAKVADLEKQLADTQADLAIATGKMTAPVVA